MTCEGSGTSRYNISLESYYFFFLDLKICGLWTFAQLRIAWLRPHPSLSHLGPQKTYPTI